MTFVRLSLELRKNVVNITSAVKGGIWLFSFFTNAYAEPCESHGIARIVLKDSLSAIL